mmetsp:Transcript_24529/g.35395  ORF Transcript_24529/g.35395 Transcript_24529/m.35395 type:complete len:96 (+) Transcript_24529:868-1155(+)
MRSVRGRVSSMQRRRLVPAIHHGTKCIMRTTEMSRYMSQISTVLPHTPSSNSSHFGEITREEAFSRSGVGRKIFLTGCLIRGIFHNQFQESDAAL